MNDMPILALALTLACGGGEVAPESTTIGATTGHEGEEIAAQEVTTTTQDVLVIAPFTMTTNGRSVSMSAEGQLSMDGQPAGPVFTTTGQVMADGELFATVSADGTFSTSRGGTIAVIAEDGSTTVGEYELSFGPDGTLVGGNPDGPRMTLSPADSPAKRLAMVVLLLLMY